MKKYRKLACILAGSMTMSLFAGCIGNGDVVPEEKNESTDTEEPTVSETSQEIKKAESRDIDQVHLRDKDSLYENDDDTSVVTMYLTVSKGNSSENTDHTWEEINSYSVYDYEEMGVDRYQAAALLQIGNENGPTEGMVGYGENVPNATVQIRGQTSSRNAQKNYKIELKKNKGTWRGQRTINLNKHMTEGMRFRNKLAYDLLKGIPQLISLRTQFVHLYVKDTTDGSADAEFEDYGLYTQVEQLNKTGLKNHGLDSNGQLYKINSFEFYRYEDVIKREDDADYNQKKFEKYLEIAMSIIGKVIVSFLIIAIGFKLIKILIKLLKTTLEKAEIDYGVISFSCSFIRIGLRCIVIFMAVAHMGVEVSSFIALLGSAGVAVGLALQGTLSNVAGGVLLLILKPFQVGDYIVLTGTNCEGEVAAMDIFYTKLKTVDNRVIVIPNGTLSNSNLINNTKQDRRLIDIEVGISYDADIKEVKRILTDIAKNEKRILDQDGVKIFVSSLADSSVMMGIRCWVPTSDYVATKWALNEEIKIRFDEEGIEIPYQKLDVCIKNEV